MAKNFFSITGILGVLFITAGIGAADRLFIAIGIGCIALILIFVWAELYFVERQDMDGEKKK